MVLLLDVGQVETTFGQFGDNVNLEATWMHSLHRMSNRLENRFGHTHDETPR
jgi:hypothetical protein